MLLMVAIGFLSYVCGSVPFGKLIAASRGIDIQKRGSGNIGFANVLRVMGWKYAVPVLVFDCLKGLVPTSLALYAISPTFAWIAGIAAVLGHIFPVWLKFKGGKGVATSLGVLLAVTPIVGLVGFGAYIAGSLMLRNSSSASITAGVVVLIFGLVLYPQYAWAYATLLLIALWALRKNLFGEVPNYDI
jgi:glycerol-3-phosphate acyltransferase PlsY